MLSVDYRDDFGPAQMVLRQCAEGKTSDSLRFDLWSRSPVNLDTLVMEAANIGAGTALPNDQLPYTELPG